MKLTQADKAICVQGIINSYTRVKNKKGGWVDIPEGAGAHGKVDWSLFEGNEKGSNCVNWYQEYNGEEYACFYTGMINHPQHGKIGVVCFQGTSEAYNGIGWKSNFTLNQVNQLKDFHTKKGRMVIPYGNEESAIKMHEGIIGIYFLARDIVKAFVMDCFNKGIPVWFYGHSQGGGVTTAAYIDAHYMLTTDPNGPKITQEKSEQMLTGYAAATLAIGNGAFVKSFNKRANGNFYNEWILGDTVHDVPPFVPFGYCHVDQQRSYTDAGNAIGYGPLNFLHFITLGFLPSPMVWNHDPRKLLAAVKGEPIPWADPDTTKETTPKGN